MKRAKKIILTAIFGVMFGITGVFLASCGTDTSKLSIDSSVQDSIDLEVGETQEITFRTSNYGAKADGEVSISAYDGTASVGSASSTHISFTTSYNNNGVTTVTIEGVSGGKTTLVASSNVGGNKTKSIVVNVVEYATSVSEKANIKNYVSVGHAFTPSLNSYNFGETVTERELAYYYEYSGDGRTIQQQFTSVELVEVEGYTEGQTKQQIVFKRSGEEVYRIASTLDAQVVNFVVKYPYDNVQVEDITSSFTILYGFEESDVSFYELNYDAISEGYARKTETITTEYGFESIDVRVTDFTLIAYKQDGEYTYFEFEYPDSSNIVFDYSIQNPEWVAVQGTKQEGGKYYFKLSNKTTQARQTKITFNIYYEGFKNVSNGSIVSNMVTYSKTFDINLLVKPTVIRANGEVNGERDVVPTVYTVYKHNILNGGWQELDVGIYNEDSTFNGYKIEFENSNLEVRVGTSLVESGSVILKKDLNKKVYFRGKTTGRLGSDGKITLSVISDAIISPDKVSVSIAYNMKNGANTLAFLDNKYNYNTTTNTDGGIYLAMTAAEETFSNIYANESFENVTFEKMSGIDVVTLAAQGNQTQIDGRYFLNIRMIPKSVGNGTYKITLDNGMSINITVRVIDELIDAIISQYLPTNPEYNAGVYSFDQDENIEIKIRQDGNNKFVALDFSTTNGKGAIKKITSQIMQDADSIIDDIVAVRDVYHIYKINAERNINGVSRVDFLLEGYTVENNYYKEEIIRKTISIISYTLAQKLTITDSEDENVNIRKVVLYAEETASLEERVETFAAKLEGTNAFGFREYINDLNFSEQNTTFKPEYLYWVVSGVSIKDENGVSVDKMVSRGGQYLLYDGSTTYARFEPSTMSLTAVTMGGVFSLTATVAQYGATQYYNIDVSIEGYVKVKNLSFEEKWAGFNENVKFRANHKTETFVVFLESESDLQDPTNTELQVIYSKTGVGTDLFLNNDVYINKEKLTNLSYKVTVTINPAVLEAESIAGGELQFLAKAWVANGAILTEYTSKVLILGVAYENGSEENPYSLNSAEDVLSIKDGLGYHYTISKAIDVSSISSSLPLGVFSGKINGTSSTSAITGINVTSLDPNNFGGLFTENAGEIRNIQFEGNIDVEVASATAYVGIVAGKNSGTLYNVAVKTIASDVNISTSATVYVGGVVGENSGTIIQDFDNSITASITTIYMRDYLTVSGTGKIYAGGIAGKTNSQIEMKGDNSTKVNYEKYMAYTLIQTNNFTGEAYLGGIAGEVDGTDISSIHGVQETPAYPLIVGGHINASVVTNGYVGGIAGTSSEMHIKDIVIRTFIRGANAGAISGNVTTNGSANNVVIQAIDDKSEVEIAGIIYALPMIIKEASSLPSGFDENKGNYALINNSANNGYDISSITFESYRTKVNELDTYDYVILDGDNVVTDGYYQFTTENVEEVGVTINDTSAFGFEKMTGTEDVFYMYYFEAKAQLVNGEWQTEELYKAQKILDEKLNRVAIGSALCSFKIDSQEVKISSKTTDVLVVDGSYLIVKRTGLAELELTSFLNERVGRKIYIYVVNYFDASNNLSMLTIDGNRLNSADITIYDRQTQAIDLSPIKSKTWSDGEGENAISYNVNGDGTITLDNLTIALSNKNNILINVSSTDANLFVAWETGMNGITLSRTGTPSSTETNSIKIATILICKIGEETYTKTIGVETILRINYKQGATDISTNTDSYRMNSSQTVVDSVYLVTDEEDATIEGLSIKVMSNGVESNLFTHEATPSQTSQYSLTLKVNKSSAEYRNRWTENIYKDYTVYISAKTTGITKEITLTLENQTLNTIVIDNYSDEKNLSLTTNKVVPNQYGLLSITLVPSDLDFNSISVSNASVNYFVGSSLAGFKVGYLQDRAFKAITSGITRYPGGFSITREAILEEYSNFDGQLYIQYSFANSSSVLDGSEVGFNISIVGKEGELVNLTKTYTINKQFIFNVSIPNKVIDNGTYNVARGMYYDLEVENNAFDIQTISISSSNTDLAQIERTEDGTYRLKITNLPLNYSTDQAFKINYSASRVDISGNVISANGEFNCKILEYVLNYAYDATTNYNADIVSGMEDGNITIAIGNKKSVEIDFDAYRYIEFDSSNALIVSAVKNFLNNLTNNGTWTVYTNLVVNQIDGEKDSDIASVVAPRGNNNGNYSASSIINSTSYINTQYFTINGHSITPNTTHDVESGLDYVFTYDVNYKIENGIYLIDNTSTDGDAQRIKTEFSIRAYLRGSEESPNPIYNYTQLKEEMQAGAYYILMNDIEVSASEFEPIELNVASIDGNGYKIKFVTENADSVYDIGELSSVGLFSSVSSSTVVKNLTIQLGDTGSEGKISFKSRQTTGAMIGLLTARNSGVISNCSVVGAGENSELNVSFDVTPKVAGFFIAGLIGDNSGKITNSRVEISITGDVSIAGLVSSNSGLIASSYFANGVITNTSSEATVFTTAGLVTNNSENARIITSYTSGVVEADKIYSPNTTKKISSKVIVAGFVATNKGEIEDCYSNIPIETEASSSGFVYTNGGTIERCFSTSIIIDDNNYNNHGFFSQNIIEGQSGSFKNCYYLSDTNAQYFNNLEGRQVNGVNTSLSEHLNTNDLLGVKEININEFKNLSTNFSEFAYVESTYPYSSVWFYPQNIGSDSFNGKVFAKGRLELSSANIVAFAQRSLIGSDADTNGIVRYRYATSSSAGSDGSITNPYLISTAQQLETYMLDGKTINTNRSYFRLIDDIDYSKYTQQTRLYNVRLAGILEGNGMIISGVEIVSDEIMTYGGLFSRIYGSDAVPAGIMNLSLVPTRVTFSNAENVGGLAGQIENGNIFNVNIYNTIAEIQEAQESTAGIIVSGKNIVGGLIGRAAGNYNIKGITSLVGAKATYITTLANENFSEFEIDKYSYAGGVIGYANAVKTGKIGRISIYGAGGIAIAEKAGLVFGGLGKNVKVDNVRVEMNSSMLVRAYTYGGIIVGESRAELSNIIVKGTGSSLELFNLNPYIPSAVGGIAGRIRGGNISNVYMGQSILVTEKMQAGGGLQSIENVGGIAGKIDNSTVALRDIILDANILARRKIGGIAGAVRGSTITMNNVAIYSNDIILSGLNVGPQVGGFIGAVETGSSVIITDAYSHADIVVSTYSYNAVINANVGSIVGSMEGVYQFKNIYTMTTYDISISDNSSSEILKSATFKFSGDDPEAPATETPKWTPETKGSFVLNQGVGTDVYFYTKHFLFDEESEFHFYNLLGADQTTNYKVKTDVQNMNLNQNEYGKSIGVKLFTEKPEARFAEMVSPDFYYDLFKGPLYTGWLSDGRSVPNLEFEAELMAKVG